MTVTAANVMANADRNGWVTVITTVAETVTETEISTHRDPNGAVTLQLCGEEVVTKAEEVSVDTDQTVHPVETITRADKAWNSHRTAKSAVDGNMKTSTIALQSIRTVAYAIKADILPGFAVAPSEIRLV